MKGKTVVIIIAIMAVVGIAVFLIVRRRRQNQEIVEYGDVEEKSSTAPALSAPAQASAPATTGGAYPNEVSGVKYAYGKTSNGTSLSIEGGKSYEIPTAKTRTVQQNLIDGFTNAAKASSILKDKTTYLSLVDEMNKAGGADGVFGKATARAFAYGAAKVPLIFKQYVK